MPVGSGDALEIIRARYWQAIFPLLAIVGLSAPVMGDEPYILDAIIVTAQKREQPLQDVPLSVAVVDGSVMEKARVEALEDLQRLVPNFSLETDSGFQAAAIRGIGGGGRNIGFEPRVGVYVDGVYMGQSQALTLPLQDIERVEVLRGPQGNLFGRNTDAGVVSITTRAPTDSSEASLMGAIGNFTTGEAKAVVSGPLSDGWSARLATGYQGHDGFARNLYDGTRPDDLSQMTARGDISFHGRSDLLVDMSADYAATRSAALLGEPVSGLFGLPLSAALPMRTVDFNIPPKRDSIQGGGSIRAVYDAGQGRTLTSVTAVRRTVQIRQIDTDYSPADLFSIHYADRFLQESEELRIASANDRPWRYLTGFYALHETADTRRDATAGRQGSTPIQVPGVPTLMPFGSVFDLAPGADTRINATVETESGALFGTLDVDLFGGLTLNLGERLHIEGKQLRFHLDGSESGGLGLATLNNYRDSRSDFRTSPSAGLTWAATGEINIYGKYSTGFKTGGWNVDYVTPAQVANGLRFDTESVDNYETGLKGSAFSEHLQYDLAAFDSEFSNYQVFQLVDLGNGTSILQLRNAAQAVSRGVELSLKTQPVREFTLTVAAASLDAHFRSFPGGGGNGQNLAGNRLPFAPRFTAAVGMDYTAALPGWRGFFDLYGNANYRGTSFSNANNNPETDRLGSRRTVDLRLSYLNDSKSWEFGFWAKNLFDSNYLTLKSRDFFGNLYQEWGAPRTFGATARISF